MSFVLVMLFGFNVSAQNADYKISVPDSFTQVTEDQNIDIAADILKIKEADLQNDFTNGDLVYLALSEDGKTQIKILAVSDSYSAAVGDISKLDENSFNEFVNAVDGESKSEVIQKDGRKFVKIKKVFASTDNTGNYTVTQYVTIANNMTYYLACYNDGIDTSNEVNAVFESFNIPLPDTKTAKQSQNDNDTLKIILAVAGIVVGLTVAVFMIIGIVKLNSKHENEDDYDD